MKNSILTFRFNFPILLTLSRLVFSVILLPWLFFALLPLKSPEMNLLLGILFGLISITDFFDGFLARKYNQTSKLGAILDPIADKFLLFSTLITLVYFNKIFFYWAIIFIGRELLVMSLRQIALTYQFNIPVISTAKLKTCFQMIYLFFVIINTNKFFYINLTENILLVIALYLTVISLIQYFIYFVKYIKLKN